MDPAAHDFTPMTPDRVERVVTDDGLGLHVEIDEPAGWAGRATALLVPGFCHTVHGLVLQRRALRAAGHRVVILDHRSHGRSDQARRSHNTVEWTGRDLRAVLEQTCAGLPTVAIGHSMGGMTMLAYAAQHPELVSDQLAGAAFVGTSAGGSSVMTFGLGEQVGTVVGQLAPRLLGLAAGQQPLVVGAVNAIRFALRPVLREAAFGSNATRAAVDHLADLLLAQPFSASAPFLASIDAFSGVGAAAAYASLPSLVLIGDRDRLTPLDHAQALHDTIPGSAMEVVPGGGHCLTLDHPAEVNDALLRLLARVDRGLAEAP